MACRVESQESLSSFFSDSPTIENVDKKIRSLQRRVFQIHDEIRQLEEYKNTRLLVVSKLPPEVLSIILEFLALGTIPLYPGYAWKYHNFLLPATQVCRLWRQVALDSPRIWGCIYTTTPPRLVKLFLERAKSAPLYLKTSTSIRREVVLTLLDHLPQMKEINLKFVEHMWLKRITSEPTPILETLALESHSKDTFTFSPDAFPALRHLSLKGYICKTNLAFLTYLRSIAINSTYTTEALPTPVDFFTALNDLPHLSSLTLVNALAPPVGPTPSLSIGLPSLTDLSIEDRDVRNIGLMACIIAPRIKTIKLWTNEKQADSARSIDVVAAIYLKLPHLTHSRCEFILSTRRSLSHAHVRVWTDCTEAEQDTATPFFDFKVIGTGDLQIEESVLTLFPSINVPPTLYFSSDVDSFNDDALTSSRQRILRQLTDITEVHADRLIDLALIMCDTPTKRGQTTMSLPSWKKMVLHDVFYIKYKTRILARLKKQLKARKAANAAIETWQFNVRSTGASLTSADVQQFEDLVDAVELGSRQCHEFIL